MRSADRRGPPSAATARNRWVSLVWLMSESDSSRRGYDAPPNRRPNDETTRYGGDGGVWAGGGERLRAAAGLLEGGGHQPEGGRRCLHAPGGRGQHRPLGGGGRGLPGGRPIRAPHPEDHGRGEGPYGQAHQVRAEHA